MCEFVIPGASKTGLFLSLVAGEPKVQGIPTGFPGRADIVTLAFGNVFKIKPDWHAGWVLAAAEAAWYALRFNELPPPKSPASLTPGWLYAFHPSWYFIGPDPYVEGED